MSRELADHLKYYEEIGVTGVSRDPKWRQRADSRSDTGPDSGASGFSRIVHSYRNARIGSIRLARVAGIIPAAADTAVNSTTVPIAIHGSFG